MSTWLHFRRGNSGVRQVSLTLKHHPHGQINIREAASFLRTRFSASETLSSPMSCGSLFLIPTCHVLGHEAIACRPRAFSHHAPMTRGRGRRDPPTTRHSAVDNRTSWRLHTRLSINAVAYRRRRAVNTQDRLLRVQCPVSCCLLVVPPHPPAVLARPGRKMAGRPGSRSSRTTSFPYSASMQPSAKSRREIRARRTKRPPGLIREPDKTVMLTGLVMPSAPGSVLSFRRRSSSSETTGWVVE